MASATASPPFSSEHPLWRDLYNEIRHMEYGTTITYETIDALVGRPTRQERAPIYRAQKELERHDQRTLICEPTIGYRIANPDEHRPAADKHRKRSYRQIGKARRRISSAPRDRLPEDEIRRLDEMDVRMSQLELATRSHHRRIATLEHADTKKTSDLDQIKDALAALKAKGIL